MPGSTPQGGVEPEMGDAWFQIWGVENDFQKRGSKSGVLKSEENAVLKTSKYCRSGEGRSGILRGGYGIYQVIGLRRNGVPPRSVEVGYPSTFIRPRVPLP